jgi:hypothetical protein
MKINLCLVALLLTSYATVAPAFGSSDIGSAVVKIYTAYNEHDYDKPWQMSGLQKRTGSGCIIKGKRILTNATEVKHAGISRHDSPQK